MPDAPPRGVFISRQCELSVLCRALEEAQLDNSSHFFEIRPLRGDFACEGCTGSRDSDVSTVP
jgi:hypothetical protein